MSQPFFDESDSGPTYPRPQRRMGCGSCFLAGCGCAIVVVLFVGLMVTLAVRFAPQFAQRAETWFNKLVSESEPYATSVQKVQEDAGIRERLGEPIEPGRISSWHVRRDESAREAQYRYEVVGPQGTAQIEVEAEMRDNEWVFKQLRATFADGTTIDVNK